MHNIIIKIHRLISSEVGGILVKPILLEGSCKALEGDDGPLSMASGKSSSGKELTREPYTCERLTQIRGGYRALTAASPVLQFDFTNPEVWLILSKNIIIPNIMEDYDHISFM